MRYDADEKLLDIENRERAGDETTLGVVEIMEDRFDELELDLEDLKKEK